MMPRAAGRIGPHPSGPLLPNCSTAQRATRPRGLGTRLHVVHVAAAEALERIHAARQEGLPITAETCPHYLHFAAEDVPDGATEMKCAPPIRGAANREDLWTALGAGWIDLIATDHSPSPPEMKLRDEGDFVRAWGGIASVQLGLSAVWRGARERGYTPGHLAHWMSAEPARLAASLRPQRLPGRAGRPDVRGAPRRPTAGSTRRRDRSTCRHLAC